jgi:hypothetical protein
MISRHGVSDLAADRETESTNRLGIDARRRVPVKQPRRGHQDHEFGRAVPNGRARDAPIVDRLSNTIFAAQAADAGLHDPVSIATTGAKTRLRSREGRSTAAGRYLDGTVAASRLRPFALRRFRTARPALVFMRDRKPCFRSRLMRLG